MMLSSIVLGKEATLVEEDLGDAHIAGEGGHHVLHVDLEGCAGMSYYGGANEVDSSLVAA
jgi:hypothetical protein